MLTVHHLGISQCERILWLCEELDLPYELVKHTRDPLLSPQTLKDVPGNETGKSPFVVDNDTGLKMSESGAIVQYIIHKYGNGRLAAQRDDPNYWDYLYWFNYSNATLQPAMIDVQFGQAGGLTAEDNLIMAFIHQRLEAAFRHIDQRLASSKYLAGPDLTAADIMTVYSFTTQRYWGAQADLGPYEHILRWLKDCSSRETYQRAMEKGDPDMKLLLGAKPPEVSMITAGGVTSNHWKKEA